MNTGLFSLVAMKMYELFPHDFNNGWGLKFRDTLNSGDEQKTEAILTIYNPVQFLNLNIYSNDPKGFVVKSVEETTSKAEIRFYNEAAIIVDLREESFRGPEAMILQDRTGEWVVWN